MYITLRVLTAKYPVVRVGNFCFYLKVSTELTSVTENKLSKLFLASENIDLSIWNAVLLIIDNI